MDIQPTTEDLIYKLIQNYLSFPDAQTSLQRMEDTYTQLLLLYPETIPYNFINFFNSLSKDPLKDLLPLEQSDNIIVGELFNTTLFVGDRLREVAMEFYHDYKENKVNPIQNQQTNMKGFLHHCINADYREKYQSLYTAVRVRLYNKGFYEDGGLANKPQVNIQSENEFERWIIDLDTHFGLTHKDETFIRNLYDHVLGPKEFIICNHCHLPMKDEHNCYNNYVCFTDKRKNKHERRKYTIQVGESAYIPKTGCVFYNVIPGLEEYRIYNVLKAVFEPIGAEVELFPNLERNGDIGISYEGEILYIDVKDYRKPEMLAYKMNSEPHRFLATDYIYIPDYRKVYSDYMEVLRGSVNISNIRQLGGKVVQFVNEKQLVEDIHNRLFPEEE